MYFLLLFVHLFLFIKIHLTSLLQQHDPSPVWGNSSSAIERQKERESSSQFGQREQKKEIQTSGERDLSGLWPPTEEEVNQPP